MARSRVAPAGGFTPPTVLTESSFQRMIRDLPRTSIPTGGVYDSRDFLLYKTGFAQKRGGTSYAGSALTSATYAAAVAYADFSTPQLVAIGDNGHLYKIVGGVTTDVSTMGAAWVPLDRPKLRVGGTSRLLVIPTNDGTSTPKTYDGTTVAALGGSPPAFKYFEVYKTRVVGAGKSGSEQRMFFSPTPDITSTWDTTDSWIDADHAVTGFVALNNSLLIFSTAAMERITGSTPPPGSDMDQQPIGAVGCIDARSIIGLGDSAIFANTRGVYQTNGAGFRDLTLEGGMASYWQSQMSAYDPSTYVVSAGLFRNSFVFVTIMNGSTLVDTLLCYLPRNEWVRLTNVKSRMYDNSRSTADELYYADRSTNRVVSLSGIFNPTSSNTADADGTAVAPLLETRALGFGQGAGIKNFGFGRVSYDMEGSGSPTLAVTCLRSPTADTTITPPESPLAKTTTPGRKRISIFRDAQAMSFRLTQSGASTSTLLEAIEVETQSFPPQADGVS